MSNIPYQSVEDSSSLSILLKGAPGSGKTYKACQFGRVALFNFDNNTRGLMKLPEETRNKVKVINPRVDMKGNKLKGRAVWTNFINILNLVVDDPDIDTIVFDSLTTMQEILAHKILASESPDKQMTRNEWGAVQRYWTNLGEEVLTQDHGKTMIFIAHEKEIEDEGRVKYQLSMGGSSKDTFDVYFTDVWRCAVDSPQKMNDAPKYMVFTIARPQFKAKRSLDLPNVFEWDKEKDKILNSL